MCTNAQPNWDRWHELRDIRYHRRFTDAEQAEYNRFLPIVAKLDAEAAAVSNAAVSKLVARHERALASVERLTAALLR
jgi:hypothetical protein